MARGLVGGLCHRSMDPDRPTDRPAHHPPPNTKHSKAKGFEIGCELGYYAGCAAAWLAVMARWNERGGAVVAEGAGAAVESDAAPPAENVDRCVFIRCGGRLGMQPEVQQRLT